MGCAFEIYQSLSPPMEYSENPMGFGGSSKSVATAMLPEELKAGPPGIVVFDDYEEGLAYAKKVNKPIMLDFTGSYIVNCRKMENNVWSNPNVLSILKEKVVVISLCRR